MTWQTPQLLQLHLETRRHKDKENGLYDWVLMAVTMRPCKRLDNPAPRRSLLPWKKSSRSWTKKRKRRFNLFVLQFTVALKEEDVKIEFWYFNQKHLQCLSTTVEIWGMFSVGILISYVCFCFYFVTDISKSGPFAMFITFLLFTFFIYKNHSTPFFLRFIIWWVKGE